MVRYSETHLMLDMFTYHLSVVLQMFVAFFVFNMF